MKFLHYIFVLSLFTQSMMTTQKHTLKTPDPILVCVIMIKNEALVIEQTLQPLADGGITAFVVLDTGSTDKTIEVVKEFFRKNNITQGHIIEQPFVNFSVSRNYALECAEQIFPDSGYLFMIDAEWYVEGVEKLIEFCKEQYPTNHDSLSIKMYCDTMAWYNQRIFKTSHHIRFHGSVHEHAQVNLSPKIPDPAAIKWAPSTAGLERSQQRWHRDLKLLLKDHQHDPNNARTLFYLAQTYAALQDWQNACLYYHKRCELHVWPEEDYIARYRLAKLYEYLNNWDIALEYYLQAYHQRPSRIEPLIAIAQHYWNIQEFEICYILAKQACCIPYPINDVLFIEKQRYDHTRYHLLYNAAAHVHDSYSQTYANNILIYGM